MTISYFTRLLASTYSLTKMITKVVSPKGKHKLSKKRSDRNIKYNKVKFVTTIVNKFNSINKSKFSLNWINRSSKLISCSSSNFNSYLNVIKYHGGCRPIQSIYKKSLRRFLRNTWLSGYGRGKSKVFNNITPLYNPLMGCNKTLLNYTKRIYRPSKRLIWHIQLKRTVNKSKRKKTKTSNLKMLLKSKRSFKKLFFRSKNVRRSLFSKKIFKSIKLSRSSFRVINHIRSKGKNRLIKAVKSFNHTSFYSRLLRFEMSALSVLLKTSFVWSFNDAKYLINSGYFYVNGNLVRNAQQELSAGSRLQLPITKSSFVWFGSKKKSLQKGYKKANRLRWYKKRVRSSRFRKRSYLYPKWLFKYVLVGSKSPNLLEIDYSILSAIVLYKPIRFNELNSPLWLYMNIHAYNIYLWKLIN